MTENQYILNDSKLIYGGFNVDIIRFTCFFFFFWGSLVDEILRRQYLKLN